MTTRRELLQLALGAVALPVAWPRAAHAAQQATAAQAPFALPPLPYPADALEPFIDAQTMTLHHDRHHQAYVNGLNEAIAKHPDLRGRGVTDLLAKLDALPADIRTAVRNHGGGHLNHDIFWQTMRKGGNPPSQAFGKQIDSTFGSMEKWRETMATTATGVFGSGWAWLSWDPAKKAIVVEPYPNQHSPAMQGKTPLLGVDVWEHAYYLKYQNRRREYVDAWFNVIDWAAVEQRWEQARKG